MSEESLIKIAAQSNKVLPLDIQNNEHMLL